MRFMTIFALCGALLAAACQPPADETQASGGNAEQAAERPAATGGGAQQEAEADSLPTVVPTHVCVAAGLEADSRTEEQATGLWVGTMVTINGRSLALPEGGSYSSLCEADNARAEIERLTLQLAEVTEQLEAADARLEAVSGDLAEANGQLDTWRPYVWINPNADRDDQVTWKTEAEEAKAANELLILLAVLASLIAFVAVIVAVVQFKARKAAERRPAKVHQPSTDAVHEPSIP